MGKVAELDWRELATYIVFSLLFGWVGLDRFFKGQVGWGILKLITAGGLGVWWAGDAAWYAYCLGKRGQWRG